MSEISEKAIELIKDLRRDISIDIMFTPEKNAEDDSLKALVDYIAELEAAQRWVPVSERLPEIGVRVLFYNNFITNIHKGWYSGDEWTSDIGIFYNGDKLKRITHWIPLPESPNDTQTDTVVYGKDSKPIPSPEAK